MDSVNASKTARAGYILGGLILIAGISLAIVFSRHTVKLPAEASFAFFTEQTSGEINFYQTQVKVQIVGSELRVGYTSYGVNEAGVPMKAGEKYLIRGRRGDVIECTDTEGRVHRVEFFRDADKVVVGARIIGPDRVLEFHVAE